MDELRLLSWNIAHRSTTWSRLTTLAIEHRIDVALLQEAGPPDRLPGVVHTWPPVDAAAQIGGWHTLDRPDSSGRRWCAAIAWFDGSPMVTPVPRIPIWQANWDDPPITHPGQFAVAEITPREGAPLTVVSLYGVWEYHSESVAFAEPTLHRAISDLTPLLTSGTPVVIAGDLNIMANYPKSADERAPLYETVWERLSAYGMRLAGPFASASGQLRNCPCADPQCRHVNTRPDGSGKPWQLDWVVTNLPDDQLSASALPIESGYSDHAPIVINVSR